MKNKQYLDACFYCGEYKEAVRKAQRNGDGLICGIVDRSTGELLSEIKNGRHTFVVTDKEREALIADEEAEAHSMQDMVDWFDINPINELPTNKGEE